MSSGKATTILRTRESPAGDRESMVAETAEDARRLGLADTQIRGFQPEITTSTSFPPVITASLRQAEVAAALRHRTAAALRRSASLFAALVIVSAGLFLYFFPRAKIVEQKAPEQTLTFSVSAIDSKSVANAAKDTGSGETAAMPAEKVVPKRGPLIAPGGRNFAYAREPRSSGDPDFGLMQSSGSSAKRVAAQGAGLQPAPGSQGRFLSRSGVQWQGAWESGNPAGNIQRGEEYLRYLRGQFSGDAGRALTARQTGLGPFNKTLPAAPARDLPLLSYSK